MNWSTRLRRWVRIRMPPVREASMKPTAATVLPAPVACSNQKRRSAPGSSGRPRRASSASSSSAGSSQSCGSSSGARPRAPPRPPRLLLLGSSSSPPPPPGVLVPGLGLLLGVHLGLGARCPRPPARSPLGGRSSSSSSGIDGLGGQAVLGRGLLLGHQLGQRSRERVDLVGVEFGSIEQLRRFIGEQPLEPEQQREVAAPLDRRELGSLSTSARAASRARRRAVPSASASGPSPSSRKGSRANVRRTLDFGACWNCRSRGNFAGIGH